MAALWLAASWCAADGVPEVSAHVARAEMTIGDVFTYQVEVTAPLATQVSVPQAEERLAPFEVRDQSVAEEEEEGEARRTTYTYQLAIFEVGEKEVRGLEVEYRPADAEAPETVSVPPVTINIASVLPSDAQDIKDIRDPVPVEMGAEQWLAAALVALAVLAALGALGWLLWRRYRRSGGEFVPPEVVAAHERALGELEALSDSDLLPRGQIKAYYTRLSEIVREYLEARFQLRAMEETTLMIDRDLRLAGVAAAWRESLVQLLRRSDLVKFAREDLPDADALQDLEEARSAVVSSRHRLPRADEEWEQDAPAEDQ